ncbi:hypothetical protein EDD18DRAFT_1109836 [Armillaria luteobubalina]|uniref:Uncharacterized protein n=1 Tax=Armillaria luteobubalina TaxID=153913 RepID=A0AA39PUE3_9AGAR|nr:hypothetical protein EDD18DRAFT_1109836 [Armillaria luteobubalina]
MAAILFLSTLLPAILIPSTPLNKNDEREFPSSNQENYTGAKSADLCKKIIQMNIQRREALWRYLLSRYLHTEEAIIRGLPDYPNHKKRATRPSSFWTVLSKSVTYTGSNVSQQASVTAELDLAWNRHWYLAFHSLQSQVLSGLWGKERGEGPAYFIATHASPISVLRYSVLCIVEPHTKLELISHTTYSSSRATILKGESGGG